LFSLGFLALSALVAPRVAQAQPADPVIDMREHFDKGQNFYVQKKYELAAAEFRAAYEAKNSASLLFNEAVCYEKMKNYSKAVSLFKQYLEKNPGARDRPDTESRIKSLEYEIARAKDPTVKADKNVVDISKQKEVEARGFVLIESKPPGATVYLDDKKNAPLGTTPWSGPIDGTHKLITVSPGFKEDVTEITGNPKEITRVVLALSQQHFLAWLEVRSNVAGADVYLDDRAAGNVGRTPFMGNVTPGSHTIIVSKEGFTEDTKKMEMVGGETYKVDTTLDKAPIGFVHISGTSIEGAIVKLDGKVVCQVAPCRFQSPDGEHNVSVEKPGLKTYSRQMTIIRATETELSVKLAAEEGHGDVIWKYGFAAAFIGGGIVLGLQANSAYDDINKDIMKGTPPIGPDDDRFLKGKIFSYAADACFLIGGITAIVGTISLLSEKGPPSVGSAESRDLGSTSSGLDLTPRFMPEVGPNYAGATMEVRW
jgi:hypothetical protein